MYSKFPTITHINDLLPHIDDNFIIAKKENHTIVDYILPDKVTFPDDESDAAIFRLECRGITFDNDTGKILRRPFQKFFNLGERESVNLNVISKKDTAVILEKLDGSMIVPFVSGDKIVWGTKMGDTHIAPKVEQFIANNLNYANFFDRCEYENVSPIFEWINPEDRIVIDYGKEQNLILTAMREKVSGQYFDYSKMSTYANIFGIPVVKQLHHNVLNEQFVESAKQESGVEGYVVRFSDGNMVKIKNDWYVQIHRAKSYLTKERHVVKLIVEGQIDDLKPLLLKEDLENLTKFEQSFHNAIDGIVDFVSHFLNEYKKSAHTKKDYALSEYSKEHGAAISSFVFKNFVDHNRVDIRQTVLQYVLKKCHRDSVYDEDIKNSLLSTMPRWSTVVILDE